MARKDLGGARKHDEFDLLLSPSRGIADDDPTSLKNPAIQERFRDHIADKLRKWAQTHSRPTRDVDLKRKNEELGIILLDLRKLREGIHSIRRVDTFACEVYESSVLLSLVASNQAQLLSSLPHLVTVIHPALARDDVSNAMSSLSVSPATKAARPRPSPATRSFYLVLHLLHSHLLPACASRTSSITQPPLSTFFPALLSLLALSSLPLPDSCRIHARSSTTSPGPAPQDSCVEFLLEIHLALVHSSLATLSTLFASLPAPPAPVSTHLASLVTDSASVPHPPTNPLALVLAGAIPALREAGFARVVDKAFRFPPDQPAWLAKWLLFEFEVRLERERHVSSPGSNGRDEARGPGRERRTVVENWEEGDVGQDDGNVEESIKREAERRAVEYVTLKKGL
ncbi:hypothetical protein JCM11491_006309 [Sporobolomyces phaffii]